MAAGAGVVERRESAAQALLEDLRTTRETALRSYGWADVPTLVLPRHPPRLRSPILLLLVAFGLWAAALTAALPLILP